MASLSIIIRIDGHPKPRPRPRAAVIGRGEGAHAHVYQSGSDNDWRECVAIAAKQVRPVKPLEGPVRVDVVFIFPRQKGQLSSGKDGGLKRGAPVYYHTVGRGVYGGDRDNLEKTILDVLTLCGYWPDDGQVCAGQVVKRWGDVGERPGALVVVTPLKDREPSGWLSELDRKMRRKAENVPEPAKVQVVRQEPPPVLTKVNQDRKAFIEYFVAKWMDVHMAKYDFQGASDGHCINRVWDAVGHDLDFGKMVIDAYMECHEEFTARQHAHSIRLLSSSGVLPRWIAAAREKQAQPDRQPMTEAEMFAAERKRRGI